MKKLNYLALFVFLIVFASCNKSDDFDTNAEYREIAVVYALLDANEIKQYVRVTKGFQNINTSAVELAQNDPEVTQYLDSIIVEINEYNSIGALIQTQELTKEFIDNKDSDGSFSTEGNYWYTIDTSQLVLDASNNYEIVVTNTQTGKIFKGQTEIINDFCIKAPALYPFCENPGSPSVTFFTVKGPRDISVIFLTAEDAEIYKVSVQFNYSEFVNNDISTKQYKSFDFSIRNTMYETYSVKNDGEVTLNSTSFMNSLFNHIDTTAQDPTVKREALSMVFTIVAGGHDLAEYVKAENAYSAITQTKPFYTNVRDTEGNNGAGIVTSRYFKRKVAVVSSATVEDLRIVYPALKF